MGNFSNEEDKVYQGKVEMIQKFGMTDFEKYHGGDVNVGSLRSAILKFLNFMSSISAWHSLWTHMALSKPLPLPLQLISLSPHGGLTSLIIFFNTLVKLGQASSSVCPP